MPLRRSRKVEVHLVGRRSGAEVADSRKCNTCGYKYNGKSGKDNTTGIVIYTVIVAILALGLVVVMFAALGLMIFVSR